MLHLLIILNTLNKPPLLLKPNIINKDTLVNNPHPNIILLLNKLIPPLINNSPNIEIKDENENINRNKLIEKK